jgi:hypothetical protein
MLKKIKTKFIIYSVLLVISTAGIPIAFLLLQLRENFEQRNEYMIRGTVELIENGINYAMMQGFQKNVTHILQKISLSPNILRIRIFKEDGIITNSSDSTEINKSMYDKAYKHIVNFKENEYRVNKINDEGVYSVIIPIVNKPECQSCHNDKTNIAYLDIDSDFTKAEVKFYTGITHMIFLGIAILMILTFSLYVLFMTLINNPLTKFIKTIDEVASGNFNSKVDYNRDDEIGYLAKSFNNMIKELKKSKEKIEELHFAELYRADKLITIGELAAEMAHEINNHSAIVVSRFDYLNMKFEANTEFEPYRKDINVIKTRLNNISKITGNILKHTKKNRTDFIEINLEKIIDDTILLFEFLTKKRDIKIEKVVSTEKKYIKGDSVQIEQVITNLLKNAIDASNNGSKVIIEINEKEGATCLEVIDFGCGIDEYSIDQIFNPFYTTKAADKGTGLGLYIVKNICKNHNAEIFCESKLNEYTKFTIVFR